MPGLLHRQVAESATSALVQTNFLISALGGVSQIQALELSEEQLQSMQLSVAVSCLSLGLGFASRDKADSAVLGLPGKLGWDATMAALVLTRCMEVSSRVFAYNILQVSVRGWPLLRFGSLVAVGLVLVSARLLFPDASLADVAAPWQGMAAGHGGAVLSGFWGASLALRLRLPPSPIRGKSWSPARCCLFSSLAAMCGHVWWSHTVCVRSGAFRDCRDEAFALPPRRSRRGCRWSTAPPTYQRSSRCIEGHPHCTCRCWRQHASDCEHGFVTALQMLPSALLIAWLVSSSVQLQLAEHVAQAHAVFSLPPLAICVELV